MMMMMMLMMKVMIHPLMICAPHECFPSFRGILWNFPSSFCFSPSVFSIYTHLLPFLHKDPTDSSPMVNGHFPLLSKVPSVEFDGYERARGENV